MDPSLRLLLAHAPVNIYFEIGLFETLQQSSNGVHLPSFCEENSLDLPSTESLVFSMECFSILTQDTNTQVVYKGEQFADVFENKGYFLWLLQGYGSSLTSLPSLLSVQSKEIKRDGAAIALAGKDYGKMHIDSYVESTLSDFSWNKVADLGCGSANRILQQIGRAHV